MEETTLPLESRELSLQLHGLYSKGSELPQQQLPATITGFPTCHGAVLVRSCSTNWQDRRVTQQNHWVMTSFSPWSLDTGCGDCSLPLSSHLISSPRIATPTPYSESAGGSFQQHSQHCEQLRPSRSYAVSALCPGAAENTQEEENLKRKRTLPGASALQRDIPSACGG